MNAGDVSFLHIPTFKLRLHESSDLSSLAKDGDARSARIQPVCQSQVPVSVNFVEDVLKRVSVETPARVHRQRSRLVHDDQKIVFIKHFNVGVDGRLDRRRNQMLKSFAGTHDIV